MFGMISASDTATHIKEKLLAFCLRHTEVYIYGAGKVGQTYCWIIRQLGIEPTGFLVSEGGGGVVEGLLVQSVRNVYGFLSKNTGVIAAFMGAEEGGLRNRLGKEPDIYIPETMAHSILWYDMGVFAFFKGRFICYPLKPMREWRNILVVRVDVLGDLIMTTPFLRELRKNCPDSHITLVVRPSNKLLFQNCPYISELLFYDCEEENSIPLRQEDIQRISEKVMAFSSLRLTNHYDIAFQPCSLADGRGAIEALLLAFASRADCQVGRRYDMRINNLESDYLYEKFQGMMSFVTRDFFPKHEVACTLDMLRQCGGIIQDENLELWFDEYSIKDSLYFWHHLTKGYAVSHWIAIGLVGRRQTQNWPLERYKKRKTGELFRALPKGAL